MTATVSSDGPWQGGIGLAIGYCVATGELSVDDIADEDRAWYAEQFLIEQDNVADFSAPATDEADFDCDNVFSRSQGPIS
jgi:ribose transport system substrate-binding protein